MKITVLGTEYEIILNATPEEHPIIRGNDGCVDFTTKKIYVAEMEVTNETWQNMEDYENATIRHEIIHAFLQESGLAHNSEWGRNETLVDWIALQIPKMVKAMDEAGALKVEEETVDYVETKDGRLAVATVK